MAVDLNGVYYKIAWTGNSRIAVVCVQDFDLPDYSFASRKDFETEDEAYGYAAVLAHSNCLELENERRGYLD